MALEFSRIGLMWNRRDASVVRLVEQLRRTLHELGCAVVSAEVSADERGQDGEHPPLECDLALVLGGDGSFLAAARALAGHGLPMACINLGRLGFMADISPEQIAELLPPLLRGEFIEEQRLMLQAQVLRADGSRSAALALNEVGLHKSGSLRMIEFITRVDGRLLNHQRADGVLVATPTGSTAYALSAGGSILYPDLQALQIIPICPHTMSIRPTVVAATATVQVQLAEGNRNRAQVVCDGQVSVAFGVGDRLEVGAAPQPLRLIHPAGYDYFDVLRAKLGWGR